MDCYTVAHNVLNFPYDGGAIGESKSDTTRNFSIKFRSGAGESDRDRLYVKQDLGWDTLNGSFCYAEGMGATQSMVTAVPVGNFGNETAGASIAVQYLISY
jgi:hypothetical protein